MARLIDAEKAWKVAQRIYSDEVLLYAIKNVLDSTDTADDVEVVRCKDCKHSKLPAVLTQKYGEPGTLTCHNWHSPCNKRNVKQADFCSYGERKDNDC